MFFLTCILPASHLPAFSSHLPASLLSESDGYTTVIQEFPLRVEIPINKAQMSQKGQAENITFYLAHCPTFLTSLPEFCHTRVRAYLQDTGNFQMLPTPFPPFWVLQSGWHLGLRAERPAFFGRGKGWETSCSYRQERPHVGLQGRWRYAITTSRNLT